MSHALRSSKALYSITPVPKYWVNVMCSSLLGFIQFINLGLKIIQPKLNWAFQLALEENFEFKFGPYLISGDYSAGESVRFLGISVSKLSILCREVMRFMNLLFRIFYVCNFRNKLLSLFLIVHYLSYKIRRKVVVCFSILPSHATSVYPNSY